MIVHAQTTEGMCSKETCGSKLDIENLGSSSRVGLWLVISLAILETDGHTSFLPGYTTKAWDSALTERNAAPTCRTPRNATSTGWTGG